MKISKNIKLTALRSFAAFGLFFLVACEKDDSSTTVSPSQTVEKKLLDNARKSLQFVIPQATANRYSTPTSFNFSSSSSGYTYSNGDGTYTYTDGSSGYNYSSSLNLSIGGSGSATIAGKAANFDYVICGDLFLEFTEEGEENSDLNFTIFIGINGDFDNPEEAIATQILEFIAYQEDLDGSIDLGNMDDYNALEDGEYGFVFYIDASDASDDLDAFSADPFSTEGGVKAYLSSNGTANVSSGSLSFNNVDMVEILNNGDEAGRKVKASGQLICN